MQETRFTTVPTKYKKQMFYYTNVFNTSVQDPDAEVFWASRILLFSHEGVERTEIILAKFNFNAKFFLLNTCFTSVPYDTS